MKPITLKVNGRDHSVEADPDTPLLFVLNDNLDLHGPRFGCGMAQCGACAVIIGGQVVGTTPMSIASDAEHRVTLRKQGFVERTVTVPRDQKSDLSFRLAPEW